MYKNSHTSLFDDVALLLLFIFLVNDIFGGALRYYTVELGLPFLAYVPSIVLALALLPMFVTYLLVDGVTSTYLTIFAMLAVAATYGVFNLGNWIQVCYGLWSLVPFLTGIVILPSIVRSWRRFLPYALCLWVLTVVGVFVNYFHSWPWIGFEYQLGTLSVSASRLWQVDQFGLFRLPGFSQASYFVAPQILILALFLRGVLVKRYWIVVWVISGGAIALTTSKTLLLIFLFFSLLWIVPDKHAFRVVKAIPIVAAAISILLPFSMTLISLDWLRSMQSPLSQGLISTFVERMQVGWPEWIRMIVDHGSAVFGRGLGGIGTAQEHFEPALFSPSDNIAVFTFATFGVFGIVILFCYARSVSRACLDSAIDRFFFYAACLVLLAGATLSVIDASLLGFTFGASFRYFKERSKSRGAAASGVLSQSMTG